MGAKVQCGNYFQGYHSMKDLNEDARSGSWSLCNNDKMLNSGRFYNNGFSLRPMNGYSEYDKEMLKQTMLKQEAIFKKQVYELHRLYRIQKALMDELKKKELSRYSFPVDMPQSSSLSFQMASGGTQNNWQVPGLPVVSSSVYTKPSISVADKIQSGSSFPKEGILQVGSIPSQNGVKDSGFLHSGDKKFPRKTFDLQLPADEYIDSEESELIKDKIPESKVKLTLGTGSVCPSEGNGGKTNSHSQNSLYIPKLVDLNEPDQGICSKEAKTSSLVNFPNSVSSHEEVGWAQLSRKPSASCQGSPKEFFIDDQMDGGHRTCLNFLHEACEGGRKELLSFNLEAGQSESNGNSFTWGFGHDKGPTSEPIQHGFKNTRDLPSFLLSDQRQTGIWFGENPTCGADISRTIPGPTNSNHVGPPPLPSPFPLLSQADDTKTEAPLVTSWRNSSLNQSPLLVQALPCYKEPAGINMLSNSSYSSIQNPKASGDGWYLNCNLGSNPNFEDEILYQNGFIIGPKSESNPSYVRFQSISLDKLNLNSSHTPGHEHSEDLGPINFLKGLDCEDIKSAKNMSSRLALPNGFGDEGSMRRELVLVDGEGKLGHLTELRDKRVDECMNSKCDAPMGLCFSQDDPQMIPSRGANIQFFRIESEREMGCAPDLVQNFSHSKTIETQNSGLSDGTNDKTILDKPHISKEKCDFRPASNSIRDNFKINDSEKNLKNGLFSGDHSGDPKLLDLTRARQFSVDLNTETPSSFEELQRANFSNISSKDEADLPSATSVPQAVGNVNAPKTDSQNSGQPENIPLGGESQNPHNDTVVSTAAKTIVAMSLGNCECDQSNNDVCHPSTVDVKDSLDWFAEVVISNGGDLEHEDGVTNGDFECSNDGSDYFEMMTLRLTETKIDEYLCKPKIQEEEEKGGGAALQSRSSRGCHRRGRQRRDFQSEILPGIASLSRHEVTQDLQTIGGLMRASGCSSPPGLTRRGAGRIDWHFPSRGRRRARCGLAVRVGNSVQEACQGEADQEGRSLKGIPWGKTTRRRRMQRFPAGSSCMPLI